MPLNKESLDTLDSVKKTGKPCKFALVYKAGDVVGLAAYRKGSDDAKIKEAKGGGTGTALVGVVDNQPLDGADKNLSFKLLRTQDRQESPIAERKLKLFLDQEAKDLKAKPAIDMVDVLPADAGADESAYRTADEWKGIIAAIKATADPQAFSAAHTKASEELKQEIGMSAKQLAADPKSAAAVAARVTLKEIGGQLLAMKPAPAAGSQKPFTLPTGAPAPQTAPAQPAAPGPVRPAGATPTSPTKAAPQPTPAAASPARPAAVTPAKASPQPVAAAPVPARPAPSNAAANQAIQLWQSLNVSAKLKRLVDTGNFDGAAAAGIRAALERAIQELKNGDADGASTTALGVLADFDEASARYDAAERACAAFGDITTILKKHSEAAHAMSLFLSESPQPQHQPWTDEARAFSKGSGGNQYYQAKECIGRGQFLQAEKMFLSSKQRLAEIRAQWATIRGPEVEREFNTRVMTSANPAERTIAERIGKAAYLENLNLAQSIAGKNNFDLSVFNPEEIMAIYGYTTEDYNTINPVLRDIQPARLDAAQWSQAKIDYEQYSKSLLAGLKKLPGYAGPVFRGGNFPDAVIAAMRQTMTFSDKAFVSTSFSHGFAGRHQFLIHAKGKGGKDVSSFSIFKDAEGEVLFLPGTRFVVKEVIEHAETIGQGGAPPRKTKPHKDLREGELYFVLEEVA